MQLEAHLEYGLLMNSSEYIRSKDLIRKEKSEKDTSIIVNENSKLKRSKSISAAEKHEKSISFSEVSDIERGRLRCLIELGHLEAAVQQVNLQW